MARACRSSWLQEYMLYTEGQESPQAFHMWTGLTVLAAALGRHVYLDRGYYKLFPNLYVMLVSEPGICKKSVAAGIGVSLLQSIPNPPYIFAQKVTPERLIQAMAENVEVTDQHVRIDSSALVYAPEASVFLGRQARDEDLIALLTTFYDCPDNWSYETKTQGKLELHNVCLSMLAASTPEWLKGAVPPDAAGGGFASRIVFVYAEKPSKLVPFPELSEDAKWRKDLLLQDLAAIRELRGQFTIDPEARSFYSSWYADNAARDVEPSLVNYVQRKPDTILKLAMLLACAEGDTLVLTQRHIEAALAIYDKAEYDLPEAVSGIEVTQEGAVTRRVLRIIDRAGGTISHTALLRKCWYFANAGTLQPAIETLEAMGMLEVELTTSNRGRIYRLKEAGKSDKGARGPRP